MGILLSRTQQLLTNCRVQTVLRHTKTGVIGWYSASAHVPCYSLSHDCLVANMIMAQTGASINITVHNCLNRIGHPHALL
jgi:hypothetical protein